MEFTQVDKRDGVGILTVSDPARRNAINMTMVGEILEAMDALEADPDVGAIVVTGEHPAFCAGADLSQLGESKEAGLREIYEGFLRLARSPLPSIAAVNGAAVGAGVNLALCCDVRLAAKSAKFDTRFLALGLGPGGGHTWMMRRAVGQHDTMATVVFGERLDGEQAERIGLVWRCLEDDELVDSAVEMAARAAAAPPEVVTRTKANISKMADVETHSEAVDIELADQVWSMEQPEFGERLAALSAKISSKSG